jgi:hypothetical protein
MSDVVSPDSVRAAARMGYAARGVVYLMVGSLAVLAAVGSGGSTDDPRGALSRLLEQPFGAAILALIAFGLVGYAVWRGMQAVLDADGHGSDAKGLTIRAALLVSGAVHLALAVWAAEAALSRFGGPASGGAAGARGQGGEEGLAGWLMAQPGGRWWVAAVGVAIVCAGVAHVVRGVRRDFEKRLEAGPNVMRVISPVSAFGLVARGIVFAVIGGFFLFAALHVDPSRAGGIERALDWLRARPYGQALFGGIALGLAAYGVYSIVEAIWRRIDPAAGLWARNRRRAGLAAHRG